MIGSGSAIGEFIDRITELASDSARRDFDASCSTGCRRTTRSDRRRRRRTSCTTPRWSARRSSTSTRRQVRRYLDFAKVRRGLLDVTGAAFGLRTSSCRTHRVARRRHGVRRARRRGDGSGGSTSTCTRVTGKYSHAAQFDLVPGSAGRQLPEGVLVCNFPRGLMEHDQVVTLFHEFGHLLHHVLGGHQQWARFSGVATEWDFVEAPSQMLEEWAWDPAVLRTFATNAAGEPIPAELVERMREADEFGKGFTARAQMFYAAVSYDFHLAVPDDIAAATEELQRRYDVFAYVPGTHFHASFGHLGRLLVGLLHLHVVAGHREGPVLGLRPRRPLRPRGGSPLPRPGPRCRGPRTRPTWSPTSSAGPTPSTPSRPGWPADLADRPP